MCCASRQNVGTMRARQSFCRREINNWHRDRGLAGFSFLSPLTASNERFIKRTLYLPAALHANVDAIPPAAICIPTLY